MSTISAGARQELVVAVAERYQTSTAAEKRRILDEFVALTGYHRKHAIRVLNGNSAQPATRRGRRCVYDEAVTEGLVVLWEASDRLCGKRLKALLPVLVPGLERHGHSSSVCNGSTPACFPRASSGLCSGVSRTGVGSRPVASSSPIRWDLPRAFPCQSSPPPVRTNANRTRRHPSSITRSA